ncbi:unnamed protein product, partial [Durusdinium trenchii]
ATRQEVAWQPEGSYKVPVAEKDALPHASEGQRSLSEVQESAQFLVQDAMAKAIMESLLAKADLPHETIALINLTPYDGMLERATRSWQESNPGTNINFRSLSMTKNLSTAQFVEKTVALELLEEWKSGHARFKDVRAYEPKPPAQAPNSKLELSSYPLRLAKVEYDATPGKRGWERYKVSLPASIRARHVEDVVHGADWKQLLEQFDSRFNDSSLFHLSAKSLEVAPAEPVEQEVLEPWDEPLTMEDLLDKYILESKMSGRVANTTLVLTRAKQRDGTVSQIVDGQQFKLFLETWLTVGLDRISNPSNFRACQWEQVYVFRPLAFWPRSPSLMSPWGLVSFKLPTVRADL